MLGDTVEHEFYLDYDSYPIAMRLDTEYRVKETRVVTEMTGRFKRVTLRMLVVEIRKTEFGWVEVP